jgi:hypothetical protein
VNFYLLLHQLQVLQSVLKLSLSDRSIQMLHQSESMEPNSGYDVPGTLVKPGLIGRLIRLFLGLLCLWTAWGVGVQPSVADLTSAGWWMLVVIGLMLVPYVVNIGLGLSAGAWPRYLSIGIILAGAFISYFSSQSFLGTPLLIIASLWLIYVFGHLGVSYLLAAMLATPGCEMRAIPQLIGMASSKAAAEHYCPAFMDSIDKWEQQRTTAVAAVGESAPAVGNGRDLMANPGRLLVIYGIPFAIVLLAGNFGNFAMATRVPAIAFLVISAICFANIWRSRRIHCYLIAPLFLLAGVGLSLYSIRMFNFGVDTWSIIVNGAVFGGACLSVHLELLLGKYRVSS